MITSLANDRQVFLGDSEYEMEDVEANGLIKAGIAFEIKKQAAQKPVEPPKPVSDEPKKPAAPKPEVKPEAPKVEEKK